MLLKLLDWLGQTSFSMAVRSSAAFYSVLDMIHQLAMFVFLGTIILVSLRLMGLLIQQQPVSRVARNVNWATGIALAVMLVTGPLLFVPEPVRWYMNGVFRWKMTILFFAILFHFTLYRFVTRSDTAGPILQKFTGALALLLWFSVGWAGRVFIAFCG
jgi:hypothetical protein